QLAHADDQDLAAGAARAAAPDDDARVSLGRRCLGRAAQRVVHGTRADLAAAGSDEHHVGIAKTEALGQILDIDLGLTLALQLLDHEAAPAREHFGFLELAEVLANLAARAVRRGVALLRVEPVARGAALLGRDDLHRLPAG